MLLSSLTDVFIDRTDRAVDRITASYASQNFEYIALLYLSMLDVRLRQARGKVRRTPAFLT